MASVRSLRRRLLGIRRRITAARVSRILLVALGVVGAAALASLALEASFWLGVGVRGVLYWTLVGLAVAGLAATLPALLRGLGLLPGLDEHALAARAEREHPGVGDRLAALLDLDRASASATPDALRAAALDRLAAEVEGVPFERVRVWAPARRALPLALAPLALLALLFVGAPGTFSGAAARLLAPGVEFFPPAPYAVTVTPGDAEVTRGADV